MRKLSLFIVLLLASVSAASAQSLLRVHLADNSRINISVNGRYFNKRGTTVTVGDLPPGRHYLKIYSMTYDRWGRMYDRLVYQGTVNTNHGMVTNFLYDAYSRRISVRSNPIDDRGGYAGPGHDNSPYRSYNDVPKGQAQEPGGMPPADDAPTTSPAPAGASPAASPVTQGSFTEQASDKLKAKVEAKGTDTEKQKLVKDVLKKETLTTFQVSYMMDWFLFESTKVEFAKWAYSITTDKENYRDLSAKFNYSSSKEELQQFLESRR